MKLLQKILDFIKRLFSGAGSIRMGKNIGVDLGTCTVLIYEQDKGIVLTEPSVVAMDTTTGEILRIGSEAKDMLGRTPGHISAIRPLRDSVISQYEVTLKMLHYFMNKACGNLFFPPRVMICVPSGVTEVEERAVIDAAKHAGADKVYLIEEPVAAALGANLNIMKPVGNMVIDIGGGTTDIAVISMGGVVVSESIKTAGNEFDTALVHYVRRQYGVMIGEKIAEEVKIRIGAVYTLDKELVTEVKGRSLDQGLPQTVTLSSKEMLAAFTDPLKKILDAVCNVIERTPPELIGDILRNGIVMTGGGSLLRGLDRLIERVTGIKTYVADQAVSCVALGTGKALEKLSTMTEGVINLSQERTRRL